MFIVSGTSEAGYLHVLKNALKDAASLRIAVSFWGSGAIERLGLDKFDQFKKNNTKILCCIESGACNPEVISDLLDDGFVVISHPKLHSKVFICDNRLIVGSANASTNGLGNEDEELIGTIEAGLMTVEPEIVRKASVWFDLIINSDLVWNVTTDDRRFLAARRRWKARRSSRPSVRGVGALLNLRDRDICVEVCELESSSTSANSKLKEVQKINKNNQIDFWETNKMRRMPSWVLILEVIKNGDHFVWGSDCSVLKIIGELSPQKSVKNHYCYYGKYENNIEDIKIEDILSDVVNKEIRIGRYSINKFIDLYK